MRMFVELSAVYLHREPVDFRKSINGLAVIVEGAMGHSPFSGALFLFCNRGCDKLKCLYWDATGFALWYKRLEKAKFHWPRHDQNTVIERGEQQLQWLLAGYDITRMRPHARVNYSQVS